jgi:hypothetical protein
MIKSRRMRWAGCVLCMREMRNAFKLLVGKPEVRETTGVDEVILKWIDRKETGLERVD